MGRFLRAIRLLGLRPPFASVDMDLVICYFYCSFIRSGLRGVELGTPWSPRHSLGSIRRETLI